MQYRHELPTRMEDGSVWNSPPACRRLRRVLCFFFLLRPPYSSSLPLTHGPPLLMLGPLSRIPVPQPVSKRLVVVGV